jgi:hypothetical protein
MRPVRVSVTGVGVSAPIPVNLHQTPFAIGLGVKVTGTVTYSVQHTFDDVYDPAFSPATAVWYNHPTLNALVVNADSNYAFPVTAIRLNNTLGTGSATLTAIQAGI